MLNLSNRLARISRSFALNTNFKPDPLLLDQGIFARKIYRNLSVPEYYEMACSHDPTNPFTTRNFISDTGALCSYSAFSTGRTPKAKRIVQDSESLGTVWWGDVNMPITELGW
mmetsp:Transcript_23242/g.3817  ORF Transcript_23242/g.3817 Transcript_23242/m.3817 type:complete len:113 (+) Transcript_23242:37-375(+)